jgi:hypothetical protein
VYLTKSMLHKALEGRLNVAGYDLMGYNYFTVRSALLRVS